MNEELRKTLEDNSKEYYRNALSAERKKEYNSAITLFFKALASLSDLYIFVERKIMPHSHSERFRILETDFPELYKKIDKNFSFYQDSYRIKISKEVCEVVRKDVEELFRLLKILL